MIKPGSHADLELTVIIVSWNVRDLLRRCLHALAGEMRLPAARFEVIVVDNASADGSAQMLRAEFPEVRLIESGANLGFGAGCNLGYRASSGRFVLLLNPDTELIDHAVDGMLDIMAQRPRAAIIAPRLVNADRSFQTASGGGFPTLRNVAWNYLFLKNVLPARLAPATLFLEGDPQGLLAIDWVSGAAMLMRREALGAQIFDESFFMFGEDIDLCDRMRRADWEVLYSSRHSIVHHHGRSFDQQVSLDVLATAHGGPRRAFRKHRGAMSVFAYDTIFLVGYLARWPLFAALARIRPGRGYESRARFSRNYLRAMFHAPPTRHRPPGPPPP